jgi:hypothetical protein
VYSDASLESHFKKQFQTWVRVQQHGDTHCSVNSRGMSEMYILALFKSCIEHLPLVCKPPATLICLAFLLGEKPNPVGLAQYFQKNF